MWRKQTRESSCNFGGNSSLIVPIMPKNGEKCKFNVKLNDYWTNLHKN